MAKGVAKRNGFAKWDGRQFHAAGEGGHEMRCPPSKLPGALQGRRIRTRFPGLPLFITYSAYLYMSWRDDFFQIREPLQQIRTGHSAKQVLSGVFMLIAFPLLS